MANKSMEKCKRTKEVRNGGPGRPNDQRKGAIADDTQC
jgi:hypothetical protein